MRSAHTARAALFVHEREPQRCRLQPVGVMNAQAAVAPPGPRRAIPAKDRGSLPRQRD